MLLFMTKTEALEIVSELLGNIRQMRDYINQIYTVKPYITELVLNKDINEKQFYLITSFLTPQARSPLWQNYFIQKIKAEKVAVSEDKGDLFWKHKYYEYKISGFNKNNMLNIIQVRKWQKCDYIVQYVDTKYNPPISFLLKNSDMKKELKIMKASVAHGTKSANKDNRNIEYRFSVPLDSEDWIRWGNQYKTELFDNSKKKT